jgi:hypothetical protein
MKRKEREGGFMKKMVIFVVLICVAFLVLAYLARYLAPLANVNSVGSGINPSGGFTSSVEVRTNPLLDFGPDSGYGSNPGSSSGGSGTSGSGSAQKGISPYAERVYLSTGNVYSAQPGDEYLVLRNSAGAPVDITGWILTNGKGTRPIETSHNSYFYPTADSAKIGQGTEFLDPSGRFTFSNIVLKSGDTAYITTGKPFSQFPFSISTSFRENICMGYLENYPFEPQLSRNCPVVTNDPQINTVTDECYDYMRSLSRCVDPSKYKTKYEEDRYKSMTSQCRAFMSARLNYPSCVANNRYATGFSSPQWRIFLSKDRELWRSTRETITLYDKNGLIVDQISY